MYRINFSILFSRVSYISPCRNVNSLVRDKAFINGDWVSSTSNKTFDVHDPSTGTTIGKVPNMDEMDCEVACNAAYNSFQTWSVRSNTERADILQTWFRKMKENEVKLSQIINLESGKPLKEALGEVTYGNSFVDFFSLQARQITGEVLCSPSRNKRMFVIKQPVGVFGLITPWNFPFAMITRKAAAVLAAGCSCVIKPAESTPLTALAIAKIAMESGIPKGALNVVTSDRKNSISIGKLLCSSPHVSGISFTGSTQVGKLLYEQCAGTVKRLSLELGGNAPFIVYESADLNVAVKGALIAKFRNCGQTCVAANRFLIQDTIYDEFIRLLLAEVKKLKLGTDLGPLINDDQFKKVSSIVENALQNGARALCGGCQSKKLMGLFYEPTVLENITQDMRVYSEEVFGPIIPLIRFRTEEESIRIANETRGGLAGYFFSQNVNQIFRVVEKMEVGMCGINEGAISTAEAPFGGIKESGIGREGSHHGLDEFLYMKYVCIGNV